MFLTDPLKACVYRYISFPEREYYPQSYDLGRETEILMLLYLLPRKKKEGTFCVVMYVPRKIFDQLGSTEKVAVTRCSLVI